MSVYNGEKYLSNSIESTLNQTFQDFELIIVNDGSTDSTLQIIKSYKDLRIRVLDQKNTGLARALNNGIKISRGKYIARIDADDINHKLRLEKQFKFMEKNPEYVLVGSNAKVLDMNNELIYFSECPEKWDDIRQSLPYPYIFHSSVLFLKSSAMECGLYDESVSAFNTLEDILLWNKLKDYGKFEILSEPLIEYRISPFASTPKIGKSARITRETIQSIFKNGFLDEQVRMRFLNYKASLSDKDRLHTYHIYLSKSYLFRKISRTKAKFHGMKALRLKPFLPISWLIVTLTIMPYRLLSFLRKLH